MNRSWILPASVVAVLGVAYLCVAAGVSGSHAHLTWTWPAMVWHGGEGADFAMLAYLRIPRVLAALAVGAALAMAGLLLQTVTRNPLADPFLLGISGGAALAVVGVNAVPGFLAHGGFWMLPVAGFAGAQLATLLVLQLARGVGKRVSVVGLVLAGVIINAFCAAFTTFMLMRFPPLRMKVTSMWLAGRIGYLGYPALLFALGVIGGSLVLVRIWARDLNAFALGADGAALVGVDARKTLWRVTWLASVLAGVAVAMAGLLGYVGLLVPHLVALMIGRDLRVTIWPTAALGALVVMSGDTLARVAFCPEEIPVGVLAALIGTPLLLVLLRRELSQ